MTPLRSLLAFAPPLALLVLSAAASRAGGFTLIQAAIDCSNGTTATVSWTMYVDPDNPPAPIAEWVGYDVFRRSAGDCGPYVRLNQEIIPKAPAFQTLSWNDSPTSETVFEYFVDVVDAQRQHVNLGFADIHTRTWTTCPEFSTPITVGKIEDWGWALYIQPCAGSCYAGAYFSDEKRMTELRPYAGTEQIVRFFGSIGCCSVEGPGILIDHYELGACGITPAARASWGQLKAIYR
jgi:hypothetical protein